MFREFVIAALEAEGKSTLLVDEVVAGEGWVFYAEPIDTEAGVNSELPAAWQLHFECKRGDGDKAILAMKTMVCDHEDMDIACRLLLRGVAREIERMS